MGAQEFFWAALLIGILLFGAEIFLPGGIVGTVGGICLLAAMAAGFVAFPGYGGIIALGIMVLVGVALALWISIFPRTGIGRRMTVSTDLRNSKATGHDLNNLQGQTGVASSNLHPSGFAKIGGRRIDVVTRGEMIDTGAPVVVVEIEGNRVVVKAGLAKKEEGE